MTSQDLYKSLLGRLTDANRTAILEVLRQETGFTRLDLFASTAGSAERVRVLSKLLALAHGSPIAPVANAGGQPGALQLTVTSQMGAIPLCQSTEATDEAVVGTLEELLIAIRTPNVKIQCHITAIINYPTPRP